jgi:hypothetical protein
LERKIDVRPHEENQRVGRLQSPFNQCHDDEAMKSKPEYVEGPEAWRRFDAAMHKVIAVPHSVIQERIAEHKRLSALNPNRRGPKPKNGAGRAPRA